MITRLTNNIIILVLPLFFFCGCKKDNYNPPKSFLTGAILYKGDTLRFSNSSALSLELWQTGFGKLTPIEVLVNQSGRFSTVLYDGNYKLDLPTGSYPFLLAADQTTDSDTISFNLKGRLNLDINVIPYYMLKGKSFTIENDVLFANFGINRIITDSRAKAIEKVYLFLGKTRIVDNSNNIVSGAINATEIDDLSDVDMAVKIPKITPSQDYVFARVGLKITSVEQMVFTSVVKVGL